MAEVVHTVTGAVDVGRLGHCQMHEHLLVRSGLATVAHPELLIDDERRSLSELADYRVAGGGAVLDAQPGGAGRDSQALRRISEESGVPIISVTGFHRPMFYERDHWIFTDSEDALRERFEEELTEGMADGDGPRVRAGAVKAAIGEDGLVGRTQICLRAAARAAARADVPLVMHTERGISAVEAVELCGRAGLSPGRILVCHADRQADDYLAHEAIARTGAFLEYDTIARAKYHTDEAERLLILHMLSRGFGVQLLLSLDTTAARLRSYGGEPGLCFILESFLPSLARAGVAEPVLRQIMVDNPARAFA